MQITGKITRWGNSLGLRINQEIAKELCGSSGGTVALSLDKKAHVLIVSPIEKKARWPLMEEDLIHGMAIDNAHAELLADPVGKEIGE
jgi:antitoxin component of MazEF toxin-antitoxin module